MGNFPCDNLCIRRDCEISSTSIGYHEFGVISILAARSCAYPHPAESLRYIRGFDCFYHFVAGILNIGRQIKFTGEKAELSALDIPAAVPVSSTSKDIFFVELKGAFPSSPFGLQSRHYRNSHPRPFQKFRLQP
jgi:hypothetical protein